MSILGDPYRMVVIGEVGSGKSSILNSLTRTDCFKVGSSRIPETKEARTFRGKFRGGENSPDLLFMDTPGFTDNDRNNENIIYSINKSLKQLQDGFNLILFCFPLSKICLDSFMKTCWKFIRSVMVDINYERIVIVLTHGNSLFGCELENAVARMTTMFIPYLKTKLQCNVSEEVLIYRKGSDSDGLDDVLKYIKQENNVCSKKPYSCIDNLIENSSIFKEMKELLILMKNKNIEMEKQLKEEAIKNESRIKDAVKEVTQQMENKFKEEQIKMESFKDSISREMRKMQLQLNEKDKQIIKLKNSLESNRKEEEIFDVVLPKQRTRDHWEEVCNTICKENHNRDFRSFTETTIDTRNNENGPSLGYSIMSKPKYSTFIGEKLTMRDQESSNAQTKVLMPRELNIVIDEKILDKNQKPNTNQYPSKKYSQNVNPRKTITTSKSQAPIKRTGYSHYNKNNDDYMKYYITRGYGKY